jgi:hypothetical protein
LTFIGQGENNYSRFQKYETQRNEIFSL